MNMLVEILVGLVAGYLVGIGLGAFTAFELDFEDAARFVAIGCGVLGAALGPVVGARFVAIGCGVLGAALGPVVGARFGHGRE